MERVRSITVTRSLRTHNAAQHKPVDNQLATERGRMGLIAVKDEGCKNVCSILSVIVPTPWNSPNNNDDVSSFVVATMAVGP